MKKINWLIQVDKDLKTKIKSLCVLQDKRLYETVGEALAEWYEKNKDEKE